MYYTLEDDLKWPAPFDTALYQSEGEFHFHTSTAAAPVVDILHFATGDGDKN